MAAGHNMLKHWLRPVARQGVDRGRDLPIHWPRRSRRNPITTIGKCHASCCESGGRVAERQRSEKYMGWDARRGHPQREVEPVGKATCGNSWTGDHGNREVRWRATAAEQSAQTHVLTQHRPCLITCLGEPYGAISYAVSLLRCRIVSARVATRKMTLAAELSHPWQRQPFPGKRYPWTVPSKLLHAQRMFQRCVECALALARSSGPSYHPVLGSSQPLTGKMPTTRSNDWPDSACQCCTRR